MYFSPNMGSWCEVSEGALSHKNILHNILTGLYGIQKIDLLTNNSNGVNLTV